ncbi:DeoR/GlpR family DNA-binding transcription regulator [Cellulomonas fimi]|uniref:DeoR/GlpR family DNA-binding transcription regulator n=1 Tax=Cellulomonas sp. RIT-PI-Y TaxID=3035297 RepID=UPI0021DA3155
MFAAERQQQILTSVRRDGRADVTGLAGALAVTTETVRRDLTALERRGLVRRVHGGAVLCEPDPEDHGARRAGSLSTETEHIARAALAELPDGGSVAVDSGAAAGRLAELLPVGRELTVVTPALPVAMTLATRSDLTLHLIGGTMRGRTRATVGSWALRELDEIRVDVTFLTATGVSVAHGLTTADLAEAAVQAALLRAARRTVVLAGHGALGRDAFAWVAPLSAVDALVTDAPPPATLGLESAGVRVVRA